MKKFLDKIKADVKFAKAGPGHKLTEDTRSSGTSSQSTAPVRSQPMTSTQIQAGSAALARFEQKSSDQKVVVPRVIRKSQSSSKAECSSNDGENETGGFKSSLEETVCFHSPFTGEVFRKKAMREHVYEHLLQNIEQDGIQSSVLMIKMLNRNSEQVQTAINTVNRYLGNVIANPQDEKYRKIRANNRVFSEKVAPITGCEEFLEASGFKRTKGENDDEMFFILDNVDVDILKSNQEKLSDIQPPEFKLYRDTQIILPNHQSNDVNIPDSFFSLTTNEIKQEQHTRTQNLETNRQLRTRAMREADKVTYNYNYCMIRVKFPDEKILQGTFRSSEKVAELNKFIRERINVEWAVYSLRKVNGEDIDNEDLTMQEADLVPTIILNLVWNEEVFAQVLEQQGIQLSLNMDPDS